MDGRAVSWGRQRQRRFRNHTPLQPGHRRRCRRRRSRTICWARPSFVAPQRLPGHRLPPSTLSMPFDIWPIYCFFLYLRQS